MDIYFTHFKLVKSVLNLMKGIGEKLKKNLGKQLQFYYKLTFMLFITKIINKRVKYVRRNTFARNVTFKRGHFCTKTLLHE